MISVMINESNEEWRTIQGYEDLYEVSNLGRVRSLKFHHTTETKVLKPMITYNGYHTIDLYNNKQKKRYLIHRIVAETFIPNPYNFPQVNHKDEDKTNNSVSNLEWCTLKYNINYGTHNERVRNKLSKKVIQYDLNGGIIKVWDSAPIAAKELNLYSGNICAAANGKYHSSGGYIWKYA